jgi:hypothetical protein
VKVRLDHVVATTSWSQWFPEASVQHIATSCSDHFPLFLYMEQEKSDKSTKRIIRYEIMWEREESLPEEIRAAWADGTPVQTLDDIATNLRKVMISLRKWSSMKFGVVTKELKSIRKRMEELGEGTTTANQEEIRKITNRMDELLYREEMMWLQRSRIAWLKERDRNTKFFHRKAVGREKKNRIKN